jgi:hypothetical protein
MSSSIGHFINLRADGTPMSSKKLWLDNMKQMSMGRDPSCDLKIRMPSAAPHQAAFNLDPKCGHIFISHSGPPNTTFLKDQALVKDEKVRVDNGDTVTFKDGISSRSFRFEYNEFHLSKHLNKKGKSKMSMSMSMSMSLPPRYDAENVNPNSDLVRRNRTRRSSSTPTPLSTSNSSKSITPVRNPLAQKGLGYASGSQTARKKLKPQVPVQKKTRSSFSGKSVAVKVAVKVPVPVPVEAEAEAALEQKNEKAAPALELSKDLGCEKAAEGAETKIEVEAEVEAEVVDNGNALKSKESASLNKAQETPVEDNTEKEPVLETVQQVTDNTTQQTIEDPVLETIQQVADYTIQQTVETAVQNVAEQKKVHAVSKKSKAKSLKQNAKKPKPAPRRRYVANNNANTSSYHEQKYNGITAALRRQNATRTRDINVQVTEFLSTIKTERASLQVRVSVPTKARVLKRASLPERVPTKARVQNSGKTLKAHSTSRVENDNSKKSTMAKISNDDNFPKGEVEASPTVDGLESSLGIYDEDDQELLANMFNNCDGLDQPDDDDNNQNVYFTEGLSITRRKENGKWVYSMVDDY